MHQRTRTGASEPAQAPPPAPHTVLPLFLARAVVPPWHAGGGWVVGPESPSRLSRRFAPEGGTIAAPTPRRRPPFPQLRAACLRFGVWWHYMTYSGFWY